MASPAPHAQSPDPVTPPEEPGAIRACLSPDVAAAFDREWDSVLDAAKQSHT